MHGSRNLLLLKVAGVSHKPSASPVRVDYGSQSPSSLLHYSHWPVLLVSVGQR